MKKWGSKKELETKNRILISVYAYAYEMENDPIVSDSDFDTLAFELDPYLKTGNRKMDKFFENVYDAFTGMWIHKHPELKGIKYLYDKYYKL